MLTVNNTGTGGCGTVSTRHAPARDKACDGPHPSAFDGIRTRGLPLRRRAPYPLGHEGEREAPDPRADWTRPPRCPVGWGRGRGRPPADREHARRGGVEPPLTVLETVVLPLDHRRRRGTDRRISPAVNGRNRHVQPESLPSRPWHALSATNRDLNPQLPTAVPQSGVLPN